MVRWTGRTGFESGGLQIGGIGRVIGRRKLAKDMTGCDTNGSCSAQGGGDVGRHYRMANTKPDLELQDPEDSINALKLLPSASDVISDK